ncbi:MAG: LCP family protein [Aulosira sp. ZfuVER01]|nr:LCP family protein [Aulosira sp. ZfuVER01]MDZ8001899.1 LCP family protein [Aulosira sp. DedVER01a]MDZ8055321.1 LCP family protein [Aulosira sp. ZfuCHP01]
MNKKNNIRKSRLLSRQPFILGLLALLFVAAGGIFAGLMSLTPLKNHAASTQLSETPTSLTGIIPATLKQPVNILILGIDNSGHPHKGKFTPAEALSGNSDTMLLIRLVPDTHQINVLSIPRDTLVHLNGVGIDKINDANVRGGPKLAASTVSNLLAGLPIERYLRVDTEGFIHLVDALGGVEVNVPKRMDYTDNTQHLSIHFPPGKQKLNGQHLQEYVRFRHDALGDIGRVQRQQEVLKDILLTLLKPGTLTKLPQILDVVKDNVDTDLSVEEMLAFAQNILASDRHQLHLMMLPGRFSRKEEYHASYWISSPQATAKILASYFDIANAKVPDKDANLTKSQTLKIAVVNATGHPADAVSVVSYLQKHGFRNVYIANHEIETSADSAQQTQIIAQHGNPDAANVVSSTLGIGQVQVASIGDILSDVTVVVEPDLVAKLQH